MKILSFYIAGFEVISQVRMMHNEIKIEKIKIRPPQKKKKKKLNLYSWVYLSTNWYEYLNF